MNSSSSSDVRHVLSSSSSDESSSTTNKTCLSSPKLLPDFNSSILAAINATNLSTSHTEQEKLEYLFGEHAKICSYVYRIAVKVRSFQSLTFFNCVTLYDIEESLNDSSLGDCISAQAIKVYVANVFEKLHLKYFRTPSSSIESEDEKSLNEKQVLFLNTLCQILNINVEQRRNSDFVSLSCSLILLSSGPDLIAKLNRIYHLLSDHCGYLDVQRYQSFVETSTRLLYVIDELRLIGPTEIVMNKIFQDTKGKNNAHQSLQSFVESFTCDEVSSPLSWLTILHRIIISENFVHNQIKCVVCKLYQFSGILYTSHDDKLHYCQHCFWHMSSNWSQPFREYHHSPLPLPSISNSQMSDEPKVQCTPMNVVQELEGKNKLIQAEIEALKRDRLVTSNLFNFVTLPPKMIGNNTVCNEDSSRVNGNGDTGNRLNELIRTRDDITFELNQLLKLLKLNT